MIITLHSEIRGFPEEGFLITETRWSQASWRLEDILWAGWEVLPGSASECYQESLEASRGKCCTSRRPPQQRFGSRLLLDVQIALRNYFQQRCLWLLSGSIIYWKEIDISPFHCRGNLHWSCRRLKWGFEENSVFSKDFSLNLKSW